ncbi:hypothetical protein [Staphylococcus phage vB_SsapH-Golestan-100]|nr:hypothetical protein [Staphylococcus phage vB_SsapH-Golestan-100]
MPHLEAYDKEGNLLAKGYNIEGDQGSVIIANLAPNTTYPQGEFYIAWMGDNYESEKVVVPEFTTLESSYKEISFYFKDHLLVKPKSAYDIAVDNGFTGTPEEWLESIGGAKGDKLTFNDLTEADKQELKGEQGAQGIPGLDGNFAPKLPITVNTPLDFPVKEYPLKGRIMTDARGTFGVKYNIEDNKVTGGKEVYVDGTNGNDSNDGSTQNSSFKTLKKAQSVLSTGDTLYINEGNYFRTNGVLLLPINNMSINIIGLGSNVNLFMADEPTWVKSYGKNNTYEFTRSAVKRVVDFSEASNNIYNEFVNVSSLAMVEETPFSWFSDGTKVFVNFNSKTPNNMVIPLLASQNLLATNVPNNFYIEKLNIYGGARPARFELNKNNNLYVNNCILNFSSQTNGNGLEVIGGKEVVVSKSTASNNYMDGFNYHIGADSSKPIITEIDCIGLDNGFEKGTAGAKSNNGSTVHDGLTVIRVNGTYGRNDGGNIADVNQGTNSWNLGCIGFESYQGKDFQTSSGSNMWLDNCAGFGSEFSISSGAPESTIYIRQGQYQNKLIAGKEIQY